MNNFEYRIKVIPHKQQRYNTVGDYQTIEGVTQILVSDMGDWRFEFLVAYHELTELALCRKTGVTDKQIDDFDISFEENRTENDNKSEPGDDPASPYFHQHQVSTTQEKMMAKELDVDWDEYVTKCSELIASYGKKI